MPTIADLKQSKFLTKQDIGPGKLVTIRGYEQHNTAMQGAPAEEKWCLNFDELDKPLVLNSTNGQIIAGITQTQDFDGWIGHKVVLFFDPNISFSGRLVGGIRVRAPKPQAVADLPQVVVRRPVAQPIQLSPIDESDIPF